MSGVFFARRFQLQKNGRAYCENGFNVCWGAWGLNEGCG